MPGRAPTTVYAGSRSLKLISARVRSCVATLALIMVAASATSAMSTPTAANPAILGVALGFTHTCALTSTGGVECWGYNASGQLGDGTTTDSPWPVGVVGLAGGIIQIDAGGMGHACALTTSGGLECWGRNRFGQLGDGTTIDSPVPVNVVGLSSGVAAFSVGGDHTCALLDSGVLKCWGANGKGQLGDGTTTDRSAPVDVVGLSIGVAAISGGGDHTCALLDSGGVKCWGANGHGQVGDGSTLDRSAPAAVVGLSSGVSEISAGGAANSCALMDSGGVKCWGANSYGQDGDGTVLGRTTPVGVIGLSSGVSEIAAGGGGHVCALTDAGGVKCWGRDHFGELGDGGTTERHSPVDVVDLSSGATSIATGGTHTCAITSEGGVKCWGGNNRGQVGDGTTIDRSTPVDAIDRMPPVSAVTPTPSVPDGTLGSYASSVHLVVAAQDDLGGFGVAETRCVLDPVSPPATFAELPAACAAVGSGEDVSVPGGHVLYVASADAVGNEETPVAFPFRIGHTLSVAVADFGAGGADAVSSPAGIDCGATCTAAFPETDVTLTATPESGASFLGWAGGGCSGVNPCAAAMSQDREVTAAFAPMGPSVVVALIGSGSGEVTSAPAGIDCITTCRTPSANGATVVLSAAGSPGTAFSGWSGEGCSGTGNCSVTVHGAMFVIATFAKVTYGLSVGKDGTGGGNVVADRGTIDCGPGCSGTYDSGDVVTLTATPDPSSTFDGWSGAGCTGTGTCEVTMSSDMVVTATFSTIAYPLSVNLTGTGTGTISTDIGGLTCSESVCSGIYPAGSVVALTAAPGSGSVFDGWSGEGCAGTGPCVVTMSSSRAITAPFHFQSDTPTDVTATAGDKKVTVSWTPPDNTGGNPIDHYTVTASPGGRMATVGATATKATVTGLTNCTSYVFTVAYTTSAGDSPGTDSAPSTPAQVLVTDAGYSKPSLVGSQGKNVTWCFDPGNVSTHTVTDSSGMGLFDSGPRSGGSTFSFKFIVAGIYPYVSDGEPMGGAVQVPLRTKGTTVIWASATPPAGFVLDVQLAQPGTKTWLDWQSGATVTSAAFGSSELLYVGPGTYQFRARLRNTSNAAYSPWSFPRPVAVP